MHYCVIVNHCFEPSRPLRIIPGLAPVCDLLIFFCFFSDTTNKCQYVHDYSMGMPVYVIFIDLYYI